MTRPADRSEPLAGAQLAIVIPSWNTRELLLACLAALRPARAAGARVIVVDDASEDGSAAAVRSAAPDVRLLERTRRGGYTAACNAGVAQCAGTGARELLLLNADTQVQPGALEALQSYLAAHPRVAAVAPRLEHADGRLQPACMAFPNLWTPLMFGTPMERLRPQSRELRRYFARDFDYEHPGPVEQPPGAALMLRLADWSALGGLDPALELFYSDVDLCLRLNRIYGPESIHYLPAARILHHGGASTAKLKDFTAQWHRDRLRYFRKHHGGLAGPWVKACTSLSLVDHLLTRLLHAGRARGEGEPLGPLCRMFFSYLRS